MLDPQHSTANHHYTVDRSKPLVFKTHGNLDLYEGMFASYTVYGNWVVGTAKDTGRIIMMLTNVPRKLSLRLLLNTPPPIWYQWLQVLLYKV